MKEKDLKKMKMLKASVAVLVLIIACLVVIIINPKKMFKVKNDVEIKKATIVNPKTYKPLIIKPENEICDNRKNCNTHNYSLTGTNDFDGLLYQAKDFKSNTNEIKLNIDEVALNVANAKREPYDVTIKTSKNIIDIYFALMGNAYGDDYTLFLLEDGSVEYINHVNAISTKNFKPKKIQHVNNVIKFISVSATTSNVGNYQTVLAQRNDGKFYDLKKYIDNNNNNTQYPEVNDPVPVEPVPTPTPETPKEEKKGTAKFQDLNLNLNSLYIGKGSAGSSNKAIFEQNKNIYSIEFDGAYNYEIKQLAINGNLTTINNKLVISLNKSTQTTENISKLNKLVYDQTEYIVLLNEYNKEKTSDEQSTNTFQNLNLPGTELIRGSGYAGASNRAILKQNKTTYLLEFDGAYNYKIKTIGTNIKNIITIDGQFFIYLDNSTKLIDDYKNVKQETDSSNNTYIKL